jgi:hypothetical protein
MYDDEHLYIGASVQDNAPGHFSETIWAADAVEIYLANWDIGDAITPEAHPESGMPNSSNGDYAIQLTCALSEPLDSTFIQVWGEINQIIQNSETHAAFKIWYNFDGYDFEVQVDLNDIASPTTGNFIEFIEGMRLPQSWSLYDIDETESSADFHGLAYTPQGYAAWMGSGPGWQYCDVKGYSLIEYIDVMAGVGVPGLTKIDKPKSFRLEQNYPNPFNPTTNVRFALDKAGEISLKIYNAAGQLVKTVIENERKEAGTYEMTVDLSNLSSGVYLSVLENGNVRTQRKMMFIK